MAVEGHYQSHPNRAPLVALRHGADHAHDLGNTGWAYRVFRGKVKPGGYHA